jgi:WhiB family redox-sensing transcriptional regulator
MSAQPISGEPRWQADAACQGEQGSVFYPPIRHERKATRLTREQRAKAVCQSCSVRPDCLDAALRHNERYGIWGGLTDVERRHLREAG